MGYKPKWYDNEQFMKMLLVGKGYSIEEAAEYLQVSDETVRKLAIKYGIKKGK